MPRRLLLTLSVMCSLTGLYAVYAALVRPLVELPVGAEPSPALAVETEPPRPLENVRIATTYLANQPWTAKAKYHLHSQQTFVYTNDWLPEGDAGRVRLQPFAMAFVEHDRRTGVERVVTVVSESALVKFVDSFQMPNPDPGRVVSAALDGPTQIAGPDGLLIDGKDFHFSESSASLYSDYPVQFAYAGNSGRADKLQVDLIPQEGVPGKDRPHIFGVKNVQLLKNVQMELHLDQKQKQPLVLVVRADSFSYDVLQRLAVYNTDVQASRGSTAEGFDWIDSDRLTVEFTRTDAEGSAAPASNQRAQDRQQFDRNLKFQRLLAESVANREGKRNPVKFNSHQHKLQADMQTLAYDGEQRVLTMTDPRGVWVRQDGALNQLKSPQIVLQIGDANKLAGAWCQGPGWLVHRVGDVSHIVFAADWGQELKYQPDAAIGLDLWELGDSATFRQPLNEAALGADRIRLWVAPSQNNPKSPVADAPGSPFSPGDMQPKRMEAAGNVVLVSPRIEANCQHLEAWIERAERPSPGSPAEQVQQASATENGARNRTDELPYHARAERIRVKLIARDPRHTDPAELWADGRVVLQQPDETGQSTRTITGSRVHLQNRGGTDQIVHIFGKPAQLKDRGYSLEAHEAMHLDRAENRVWVNGGGALQLPLKSDLEGKPLEQTQPLDVTWKERMSFDGTIAGFTGRVTAHMGERRMTCQHMQVTLSDRISFAEGEHHAATAQVAYVRCRDNVTFKNFAHERQQLLEIQEAHVHELYVDRLTGEMTAQGPGEMFMWRRGQGARTGLGPQQTVQANRPVDTEPAEWEFTHVKFDGRMDGNLERRYSTFLDRVEIVHGPVANAHEKISRDRLTKHAALMSCRKLDVMQLPAAQGQRGFIQVAGEGNVNLEGRDFYAMADQVVYDESSGLYTLRGFGNSKAKLWNEKKSGQASNAHVLQSGQFNPETREFRAIAQSGEGGR